MIPSPLAPKQSLNKAFRLLKPKRSDMETFKMSLLKMLGHIDEKESEENVKIHLMQFLKEAHFGEDFLIATKERTDFVVHTGKAASSFAGILVETKKPSNRADMITKDNLNKKAMHEIILYFLKERVLLKNNAITHVIITNIYEWFIFDANDFERIFTKNTKLVKDFKEWEGGQKVSKNTDHFYAEIAAPFLKESEETLEFTHFDIRDFKKYVENNDADDDNALIPLFKILSPTHLLKLPFTNDSNSLDKGFYSELLHIIGLEEVKDGSRKIIQRKKTPDEGSLLENTITILDSEIDLKRVPEISSFGDTRAKQLEAIALELNITWMNRILFLKLLEAQLVKYHKGDRAFQFLNYAKIPEYDELNKLFFQVLAKSVDERGGSIARKFGEIPYLNSSLFEPTALESATIRISGLDDSLELPLFKNSVLKKIPEYRRDAMHRVSTVGDSKGAEALSSLNYLLSFLDAYDFASEGSEDIQEESKTLINASVLGLIFEKINGYRDGSIFTPGFITMYMCRESIRAAVVQKMNEHFGWTCESFDDLKNFTADKRAAKDILELNSIVNGLRICDPAVGSGHFLVSALNEIIAVKSELRILADDAGVRLGGIDVNIENDELIITTDDGNFFSYEASGNFIPREAQRIQRTLFHEKQRIIENCLFGVDINPNSVKICRLRLWIELLKNAYYTEDSGFKHLETLPNIDINIKCGNSLVSRFALDADLKKPLKEIKMSAAQYRDAVRNYKNADDKEQKRDFETLINTIKSGLKTEIMHNDPKIKDLARLRGELDALNQADMFEPSAKQQKDRAQKSARLEADIEKLLKEIEDVKSNAIYRNAFEWRFEFPEVLDDDGAFKGFDVVVGNPPYIAIQDLKMISPQLVEFYKEKFYSTRAGNYDIYIPFIELATHITNQNSITSYILPSKFLTTDYGKLIRDFLIEGELISEIIDFGDYQVFDTATIYTCIIFLTKEKKDSLIFWKPIPSEILKNQQQKQRLDFKEITNKTWLLSDDESFSLSKKLNKNSKPLISLPCEISRGSSTGDDKIFVVEKIDNKYKNGYDEVVELEEEILLKPIYATDFSRYIFKGKNNYKLIFPYNYSNGSFSIYDENELEEKFPLAYSYFKNNEDKLLKRKQTGKWYGYSAARNLKNHGSSDILIPLLADKGLFTITPKDNNYTLMAGGGFSISLKTNVIDKHYLLALLNSKLIFYVLSRESNKFRGGYITCTKQYFENLPIKEIPATEQAPFKKLVEEILAKKQRGEDTGELEREIDEMVYTLYDLTAEEIAIVEGQ